MTLPRKNRIVDVYELMIGKAGRFLLKNKKEIQKLDKINQHFHKEAKKEMWQQHLDIVKMFRKFDLRKEINDWKND
jgi:hypothetical protein